jgi:hypothetical protein
MGYYDDTTNMIFSDAQSLTGGSADATNVIDTQATPTLKDLGINPMVVRVIVTTAFTAGGGFTSLDIGLKSDSTTNLDTSETVHASRNILLASLTAGAEFYLTIPPGQRVERYLGIEYVCNGAAPGAGAVTAILVPAVSSMQYFPDGSSIVAG